MIGLEAYGTVGPREAETEPQWWDKAICQNASNPNVFFPRTYRQYRWAQAWCSICPVAEECAETYEAEIDELPHTEHSRIAVRGHIEPDPQWDKTTTENRLTSQAKNLDQAKGWTGLRIKHNDANKMAYWTWLCEYCDRPLGTSQKSRVVHKDKKAGKHGGLFCSKKCQIRAGRYTIKTGDGSTLGLCAECYTTIIPEQGAADRDSRWLCKLCRKGQPQCSDCSQPFRTWYHRHNIQGHTPGNCDCRCAECWRTEVVRRKNENGRPCVYCGSLIEGLAGIRPRKPTHPQSVKIYCSTGCRWSHFRELRQQLQAEWVRRCPGVNCDKTINTNPKLYKYCSIECHYRTSRHITAQQIAKFSCELCGAAFEAPSNWQKRRRFCSNRCANTARRAKMVTIVCKECGTSFEVKPHQAKRGRAYCSRVCSDKRPAPVKGRKLTRYTPETRICTYEHCNNEFKTTTQRKNKKFCSVGCATKGNALEPLPYTKECAREGCHNTFTVMRKNPKTVSRDEKKYCNRSCGKAHHVRVLKT